MIPCESRHDFVPALSFADPDDVVVGSDSVTRAFASAFPLGHPARWNEDELFARQALDRVPNSAGKKQGSQHSTPDATALHHKVSHPPKELNPAQVKLRNQTLRKPSNGQIAARRILDGYGPGPRQHRDISNRSTPTPQQRNIPPPQPYASWNHHHVIKAAMESHRREVHHSTKTHRTPHTKSNIYIRITSPRNNMPLKTVCGIIQASRKHTGHIGLEAGAVHIALDVVPWLTGPDFQAVGPSLLSITTSGIDGSAAWEAAELLVFGNFILTIVAIFLMPEVGKRLANGVSTVGCVDAQCFAVSLKGFAAWVHFNSCRLFCNCLVVRMGLLCSADAGLGAGVGWAFLKINLNGR
ncbi:hypothetical protein Nepgr_020424 [Nepenthes gracilis]|uniref:Uncharacterized protein n=1 Tax=Nepenthes gracilis TaxID=150966 RepID=A0AAD3XV78_NEPGR|nr:hypothetical protein Nepgr_020424 [Nepenthes gracilis]